MQVLITGACGYIGSVLRQKLSAITLDIGWFGGECDLKMDFRDFGCEGIDTIIHLANIANDPSGELDPRLTWETNALGMAQLCAKAVKAGVGQFIYASSGSVYGVSNGPVSEESPLTPLTEYNKSKSVAERVLLSYSESMAVQIVRPGTICGVSPRQRLDITVNGMTIGACNGVINIVEGSQVRPNTHIEDITDLFVWLVDRPQLTGIWNAGFENLTGHEIALLVKTHLGDLPVKESKSSDRRSYIMDSTKLLRTGFKPKHTVGEAIGQLIESYKSGLKDEDKCYNLRVMKNLR